jgi:hypothetical protein
MINMPRQASRKTAKANGPSKPSSKRHKRCTMVGF